jgi:hypothetical protein
LVRGALACALLFGCGIGDTISLGTTASAPAPGGAGAGGSAGAPSGGSGGMISVFDAGMLPPVDAGDGLCMDEARMDEARCAPDAGADAAAMPLCVPQLDSIVTTCTLSSSPEALPLALDMLFEWPKPGELLDGQVSSAGMPIVGPFTDDDGNGVIDACDIPDVVLPVALSGRNALVVLSGDTGDMHFELELDVAENVVPAIADLDADGTIELVTLSPGGQLLIYAHTGLIERAGESSTVWPFQSGGCHAMAIHDLEGDGTPEIIGPWDVFENDGSHRFGHTTTPPLEPEAGGCNAPLAADLDGDGRLEVIFAGTAVYEANGMLRFDLAVRGTSLIANHRATPLPELMVANAIGLTLLDEAQDSASTTYEHSCMSPAARVSDIDQNGLLDVISPACGLTAYEIEPEQMLVRWHNPLDLGVGALSLFDLRARGALDIILTTSSGLFVHDGKSGDVLVQRIEFMGSATPLAPVIADVDNDGSADILLMSEGPERPRLLAIRARERDFAPARRIYSQYANQVTHVNENGTPLARSSAFFPSHTSAHVENGHLCVPVN